MAVANHGDVGIARGCDDPSARAVEFLRHAAAAGRGGGGVFPGCAVLPVAMVSGAKARASDQLVLCFASFEHRGDGYGGGAATATEWSDWAARMAVAVPGGGTAGDCDRFGVLVCAAGPAGDSEMAGRERARRAGCRARGGARRCAGCRGM